MGWVYCNAQSMPTWVYHLPKANNNTYYYRVTIGEGENYNSAYANAFAKAILESSWKLGVQVTTSDDIKTIEQGIKDNISVREVESKISINKVCEYIEQKSSRKTFVYCLWQIGKPQCLVMFEDFENCK